MILWTPGSTFSNSSTIPKPLYESETSEFLQILLCVEYGFLQFSPDTKKEFDLKTLDTLPHILKHNLESEINRKETSYPG
ncbi:hypothetical protein AX774_g569 [Zancudomyces culisetae]|uniref:Uncharacterized protein n=1 Tax=Zancudomyces culisetae TaxID=1213189 RepID=A0A1R1PY48_ZANCU|nr:hypothetical protein AX774_g569 [Zancudomyces culisetae]|eukprot:OMH85872.1 hypothetical protein AX774_g569 [Zancudomyces culisetae]